MERCVESVIVPTESYTGFHHINQRENGVYAFSTDTLLNDKRSEVGCSDGL